MDQLKLLWENPRNRMIAVSTVLLIICIPILISLFAGGPKTIEALQHKEAEVVQPLFKGEVFEAMEKEQVEETWQKAKIDIRKEHTYQKQRENEYDEKVSDMEKDIDLLTMQNKELQVQMKLMMENRNTGSVVGYNQIGEPILRANTSKKRPNVPGVATDNQVERASVPGQYGVNSYTQYTSKPAFHGDVVRTITQNKMREVKSEGAITETDLEATAITKDSQDKRTTRNGARNEDSSFASNRQQAKDDESMDVFLPATSIISGTLITGVDAPTQLSNSNNPVPVMMRVKKEALLPNHYNIDIRECRIIGSAIGNLSSERVSIRAELITCIREDGRAIEVNLDAYAVSSIDGKAGVRGRVVQKNGSMVAASVKAGFLEGFANAVAPQRVPTVNTSSMDDPFQTIDFGNATKSAGLRGAGQAMQRVAEYYIRLAEETFPVIELNPGIEIDFIVKRGTTLKIR